MVATAVLMISTELGAEKQLLAQLKMTEHVKEVYIVYGIYDIVVIVEADTMEKVKETIASKIRKLEGVRSTLSMLVA